MKKVLLSAIIAAMAISVCACGKPNGGSTEGANAGEVKVKTATYTSRSAYTPITDETGDYDDVSKLKGSFIESINGQELNYIFINSLGNSIIRIGEKSAIPLGIETSKDGILIYKGAKTPVDKFCPYAFDGKTLKYTAEDGEHVWKKLDKVDVDGTYHLVVDEQGTEKWTFEDGKITMSKDDKVNEASFSQSADKIVITNDDGSKTEYSYVYDVYSLELKNDKETLYFRIIL